MPGAGVIEVPSLQVSDGDRATKVADVILDLCSALQLLPGSRLPTERALATRLGVSRTTVRHGLAALEARGLVSRQVGRGTYLNEVASRTGPVRLAGGGGDSVGPAGLMAVRRLIEPCVLHLVVDAATSRDFEEMERCLRGGDRAQTADEFEVWDCALHHAIVAATHNPLLVQMYHAVEVARRNQVWGNLKRRHDSAAHRATYQQDHRAVVEALQAREADLAVRAMAAHLDRVASVLFAEAGKDGLPLPSSGMG